MYSPNGTLDTGLLLYVLGGLSKSRNGVAQSFPCEACGVRVKIRSLLAAAHSRGPAGIPGYSGWAHGIPGYPEWTPGTQGPRVGIPEYPRRAHGTQAARAGIPGYAGDPLDPKATGVDPEIPTFGPWGRKAKGAPKGETQGTQGGIEQQ